MEPNASWKTHSQLGGKLQYLREETNLPRDEFFKVCSALIHIGYDIETVADWVKRERAREYILTSNVEEWMEGFDMDWPEEAINNVFMCHESDKYEENYILSLCSNCYTIHTRKDGCQ